MPSTENNLSANRLKQALWETLEKLQNRSIDVNEAVAISGTAREIIRCTNTQLKIAIYCEKEVPTSVMEFSES